MTHKVVFRFRHISVVGSQSLLIDLLGTFVVGLNLKHTQLMKAKNIAKRRLEKCQGTHGNQKKTRIAGWRASSTECSDRILRKKNFFLQVSVFSVPCVMMQLYEHEHLKIS